MKIGVLAFQGNVSEHLDMLKSLGVGAVPVKRPYEIEVLDGLILPGGESTTVGILLKESGMDKAICKRGQEGMPIWGTCMGAILLAKRLVDNPIKQPLLGLMDIGVRRNAFGRQRESFETEISISELWIEAFPCIFIRSPLFEALGPGVESLATFQGKTVLAREKNYMASAFHPELSRDTRLHEYFLDMVKERGLNN